MKFTPLTPKDVALLDSDREFALAVIDVHFPGEQLSGTQRDLPLLQRILNGSPYTDDPEAEVVALGTSLGDLIARALGLAWVQYTDEHGVDLGLRYGETSIVFFCVPSLEAAVGALSDFPGAIISAPRDA